MTVLAAIGIAVVLTGIGIGTGAAVWRVLDRREARHPAPATGRIVQDPASWTRYQEPLHDLSHDRPTGRHRRPAPPGDGLRP